MQSNICRTIAVIVLAAIFNPAESAAVCLDGGYSLDGHDIVGIYPDPNNADVVFALRNNTGDPQLPKLYKSCDAGSSWSATAITERFHSGVWKIAIDPGNPEHVIALDNGSGFMRSIDGGITWSIEDGPGVGLLFGIDGTLYTWASGSAYDSGIALFRQLPGSGTWEPLAPPPGVTRVMRAHPADANQLHTGAAYSTDGGFSWQLIEQQGPEDIRYNPLNPAQMIRTGVPAQLSNDGGMTWLDFVLRDWEFGVFASYDHAGRIVRYSGLSDDTIWVATAGCGLWRSTDSGYTWGLEDDGLTGESSPACPVVGGTPEVRAFEISPIDPNRVYATTSDGVFTSTDGGDSWQAANGTASANAAAPPDGPFSGEADLAVVLSGVPATFNPPTTIRYAARITNYGPDAAIDVSFGGGGFIVSNNHAGCDRNGCMIDELAPGAVIDLALEIDIRGGATSAMCNGDVHEISSGIYALTEDPNPGNNNDVASMTRTGNSYLLSAACPQDQIDAQLDHGGGGATGKPFLLLGLGLLVLRARKDVNIRQ